ncbi:DUF1573 domain-containing protein [Schleiferiaceae bacterium]|nr:hypothetical protein [Flavobacteriales bacterium]MDC1022531.1 DUF1573 domain-containing protein [Schleiferiaceae bacterium]|tara:strand:- start:215 stop:658 length:444 start_codon:yes stop_codon:yes gene_type:complete
MKKVVLLATGIFVFTACNDAAARIESSSESTTTQAPDEMMESLPSIAFESDFHDFGEISEGSVAQHIFTFKNEGEGPLIISNAQGSCGCTVPDWPRNPIAPGESGEIKVSFNSKGRAGKQDKRVTLTTNAVPQTKVLNITSTVIAEK